jgi:hypothetical protein
VATWLIFMRKNRAEEKRNGGSLRIIPSLFEAIKWINQQTSENMYN